MYWGTHPNHLALGGQVRRPVGESQPGLKCVEGRLQLGLLLQFGWFVLAAVVTELLQLIASTSKCVVGRTVLQPRRGAADPLQQVAGHPLVLLHQSLVLLVYLQYFADTVGGGLGLGGKKQTGVLNQSTGNHNNPAKPITSVLCCKSDQRRQIQLQNWDLYSKGYGKV